MTRIVQSGILMAFAARAMRNIRGPRDVMTARMYLAINPVVPSPVHFVEIQNAGRSERQSSHLAPGRPGPGMVPGSDDEIVGRFRFRGTVFHVVLVKMHGPGLIDPAHEVEGRGGFVVRSAHSAPAERLLSHIGARRFVVDIEIPGRVAESFRRFEDDGPVPGENRAGQCIGARAVDKGQCFVERGVIVDVDRENGSEDLFGYGLVFRIDP